MLTCSRLSGQESGPSTRLGWTDEGRGRTKRMACPKKEKIAALPVPCAVLTVLSCVTLNKGLSMLGQQGGRSRDFLSYCTVSSRPRTGSVDYGRHDVERVRHGQSCVLAFAQRHMQRPGQGAREESPEVNQVCPASCRKGLGRVQEAEGV